MTQWTCSGDDLGPPAVELKAAGVYTRVSSAQPRSRPGLIARPPRWATPCSPTPFVSRRTPATRMLVRTDLRYGAAGKYTVVNDTTVDLEGGRRVVVSRVVATITSYIEGQTCAYVREGADAGAALTYSIYNLQTSNREPGRVWLRADGRYTGSSGYAAFPFPHNDSGTYQLSGSAITLSLNQTLPFPHRQPVVGTHDGGTLTLGHYVYVWGALP